jgi:PiT family inorganic phosphate transporter
MSIQRLVVGLGLPPIPLVPVSSSQVVVGAVIGIGLAFGAKGIRQFRWSVLFQIASGWISTPILAGVSCFVLLFFLQNVFQQPVYRQVDYRLSALGLDRLKKTGIPIDRLEDLKSETIGGATRFRSAVRERVRLPRDQEKRVLETAEIHPTHIDPERIRNLDPSTLSPRQIRALGKLAGRWFLYRWQLADELAEMDSTWKPRSPERRNRLHNMEIVRRLNYVFRTFRASGKRG